GKHLGDPMDYTAYLAAKLTRDGIDMSEVANFNLDADRGYGYKTWDWVRDAGATASPDGFKSDERSRHVYNVPRRPGYGWNRQEQETGSPSQDFHPNDPDASVQIRYIDEEEKFA